MSIFTVARDNTHPVQEAVTVKVVCKVSYTTPVISPVEAFNERPLGSSLLKNVQPLVSEGRTPGNVLAIVSLMAG